MSSWPSVSLGSLISSIRGGTSYGGENRRPAKGEVGILTLGAVGGNRFDSDACKALPAVILPQLGDPVRAGTLLMARSNTIDLVGSVVYVDADYADRFLPDLIWELSLHTDAPVRPVFLADFLSTADGRRLLQSAAMGTSGSMKKLSMARLKRLKVPAVPMALQDVWLNVRSQIDRLQVRGHALLTAKRAFKRALMNDLLTGRRRFPEFEGHPWETGRLGDLFAERNETGFDDLPLLSVTGDLGIIPRAEVGRKDTSNADKSKYKRVTSGDIAYNTMRMWQGVSALSALEGIVSPAYTVVTARGPLRADYAKHLFKLPRQVHEFLRRSQGLVDDTLNLKYPNFARVTVSFPESLDEQGAIVDVLDRAEEEIQLLAAYTDQVSALKRGLMQRLLSGEIELPEHLTTATAVAEAGDDDS